MNTDDPDLDRDPVAARLRDYHASELERARRTSELASQEGQADAGLSRVEVRSGAGAGAFGPLLVAGALFIAIAVIAPLGLRSVWSGPAATPDRSMAAAAEAQARRMVAGVLGSGRVDAAAYVVTTQAVYRGTLPDAAGLPSDLSSSDVVVVIEVYGIFDHSAPPGVSPLSWAILGAYDLTRSEGLGYGLVGVVQPGATPMPEGTHQFESLLPFGTPIQLDLEEIRRSVPEIAAAQAASTIGGVQKREVSGAAYVVTTMSEYTAAFPDTRNLPAGARATDQILVVEVDGLFPEWPAAVPGQGSIPSASLTYAFDLNIDVGFGWMASGDPSYLRASLAPTSLPATYAHLRLLGTPIPIDVSDIPGSGS